MARQSQAVEINRFNAGLITDASPLTSPDNSSLDEDNMVLNIDGSRNRRLGMDYESSYSTITTSIVNGDDVNVAITTYRWDNAGGDPERSILVVQFGSELKFFHLTGGNVSSGLFHTEAFSSVDTLRFSYAVVDGILVIANGDKEIYRLEYTDPDTITTTTTRLLIRDFFGLEDKVGGVDLTVADGTQNRPSTLSQAHTYNLRNQSWGISRISGNGENLIDPIDGLFAYGGKYPSNADTVNQALYADPNDGDDRISERFFAETLWKNPIGMTKAPQGYFIIDALDRGSSRLQVYAQNMSRYPQLTRNVTNIPDDSTPGGATVIAEFAGRVFYGGFSGEVVDGDEKSPRMSSYILFSKVVSTASDINLCYQEGDPTSTEQPDIVDTDGGFIRLNGAYGVKSLINLGQSLMVVASNGIWRIVGGTDAGFTATAYIVEKITDRGCTSPNSIAIIDNSFMFWTDDAIYHVTTDQFGTWVANNISFGKIQSLYDDIEIESKRNAKGAYDSYERKVRWVFENTSTNTNETRELVLDLQLGAYYTNTIKRYGVATYPKVVSIYNGLPYQLSPTVLDVTVGGVDVVINSTEPVTVSIDNQVGSDQRELGYLIITAITPTVQYTFGKYSNTDFREWYSIDEVGVDAAAYVVTSYMSGGDFQRKKQTPYIMVHLRRTETGYNPDMTPINPSSCLLQARWGWSNSDSSGKWGREFQAYRYRRLYLPVDANDDYDNGFLVVSSRNKLRGSGKVLSLKFRTEPYKDLHLYGWSMIFSIADNV